VTISFIHGASLFNVSTENIKVKTYIIVVAEVHDIFLSTKNSKRICLKRLYIKDARTKSQKVDLLLPRASTENFP